MALRTFTDAKNREWRVWDTFPSNAPGVRSALERFMENQPAHGGVRPGPVRSQYAGGWLTFQSGEERRRLVPIPEDWEGADVARLREYLDRAQVSPDAMRKHQGPKP